MRRSVQSIGYITAFFWCSIGFCQPAELPDFSLSSVDGEEFSFSQMRNGRNLIIFYFDPTCSHCQDQARWIADEIDRFSEVDFLWVAWEPSDKLTQFKEEYLTFIPGAQLIVDQDGAFDKHFDFTQIRSVLVYGADNRLLKKFKKEAKVERLLKVLEESD